MTNVDATTVIPYREIPHCPASTAVGSQVGGIGALVPSRKSDLARLGLRAVAAGTLANFMSACIAGLLV
jgi:nucleoside permease NupC